MEQTQFGMGLLPPKYDARDYALAASVRYDNLPQQFDLGIIAIKNQGSKPTCAAHAMSELIEYHYYHTDNKQYKKFSTEFIYGSRDDDMYMGNGMYLRETLKIAQKKGDVFYEDLPGNNDVTQAVENVRVRKMSLLPKAYPHRISTYYSISSINELKYALFHHGPVLAGMKIYDHASWANNTYRYTTNDTWSGHAVLIMGWNEQGWIVQNSWGVLWGDKGRFYIPYSTNFNDVFMEVYGVTDDINEVSEPAQEKMCIKLFYPIINWFKNLKK